MHILIINFNLKDLSREQFEEECQGLAQTFADISGLITKTWLANEETNTYGGVYHFENKKAMLEYKKSEIFSEIGGNPAFINHIITDFEILKGPSKVTGIG